MGKRPRWLAPLLAVTLALVAQAAQTETIQGLRAQIERKEGEYQQTQSQLTRAQAVVTEHEAEVRAARTALQSRQSTRDEARTKYEEGQKWALENPEFSTERLRRNYRAAQAASERAEQVLEDARQRLARATSQVTRLRATLDGYTDEINTLKRRVADAQFERLRAELSQPKTVTARGEVGCSEMTVSACQTAALEQARRRAVEQGTAVLVKGVTVVEDFQLTRDDIRSQVRGLIVNQEVLDKGWVGETSYFYEIRATVRGQVPDDWRPGVPSSAPAVRGSRLNRTGRRVGGTFRDCATCPQMVVVPVGSYRMGSPSSEVERWSGEEPVHRVTIGQPFAVGVYEVTVGEDGRFVGATGHAGGNSCSVWAGGSFGFEERSGRSWRNPGFRQTERAPVVCVNWADARAYVRWLSQQTGQSYRLLSEAEWEYVARAGTTTARYWGESASGQCEYANGADSSTNFDWIGCSDGHARTAPVGSLRPNAFGLYDVLGNVWEWTQDCWNASYAGAPSDGRSWERGACSHRVQRGGSWSNGPENLRSATRFRNTADGRFDFLGFRIARSLP